MSKLFGTDGFRGRAGIELTAEHAFRIGRFLGWYYGARQSKKCRAVIGKDTRRSSYMLEYALAAGLTCSGADAYIMHVTTTPSVAFAARAFNFDCGIVISASHNAFADNGIKILNGAGEKLADGTICLIEDYLNGSLQSGGGAVDLPFATGGDVGSVVDFVAGRNEYTANLISLAPRSLSGYKVGLDCANGAAYNIARRVFRALGARVFCIGCRPDGTNINENCGSTHPARLSALVREKGLDVGFAFDGDGDRCICADERGNIVDGDGIMYILARHIMRGGGLIGDKIVATVMSNSGLISSLKAIGVGVEVCGVGDRVVYEKMCSCGAALGGEQSGHIIVGKVENTGDGIVTALCLMQALVQNGGQFSSLLRGLTLWPQVCVSVPVRDKSLASSPQVEREVSRAEGLFAGDGRVLVRPSGTESVVRVMVECPDEVLCKKICARIVRAVRGGGICAE